MFMKLTDATKRHEKARMAGKTFARLLVQSVQVDKRIKLTEQLARIEANRAKVLAELDTFK